MPYAYAQLDATKQAAEHYMSPSKRSARVAAHRPVDRGDSQRPAARRDRRERQGRQVGWYWQLQTLPDAPETRYLYHLLATHEFQEGLKNYRDLLLMQRNLATWSLSVGGVRRHGRHAPRAFEQRLPVLQQTLDTVDLDAHGERTRTSSSRGCRRVERDDDVAALATAREHEQWAKIERIEKVLASADQSDPLVQEMREKARLLRGRLLWDFNASYKARLWRTRKELRELDVAYNEARRRWVLVERAREDYPARTEEFAGRVATLQPRIAALERAARSGRAGAESVSRRRSPSRSWNRRRSAWRRTRCRRATRWRRSTTAPASGDRSQQGRRAQVSARHALSAHADRAARVLSRALRRRSPQPAADKKPQRSRRARSRISRSRGPGRRPIRRAT